MEKSVSIYDLNIISDALPQITPAMVLLNVFMYLSDQTNVIRTSKNELAKALGKSRRTIASWIIALCKAGAIKYKYSGLAHLNPLFYFKGTEENFKKAKLEYEKFKSDI